MMRPNFLFNKSRFQLAIAYASVMGAILLLCGYTAHVLLAKAFTRTVDRELEVLARLFDDQFKILLKTPGKLPVNAQKILPELCLSQQHCTPVKSDRVKFLERGYYLRLLTANGDAIAALGDNPNRFPANYNLNHSYDIRDKNGEVYHLHLIPWTNQNNQLWGYLQVGRSVQRLSDYMNALHWLLLIGVPTSMVLIGAAGWWLAGLAMYPIKQSYEQIQQFTTNAAHELRTPIAATQVIVETALENPLLDNPIYKETLQSLYRQIKRLRELTNDLLLLSRLESQSKELQLEHICLNDIVTDIEEELIPMAMVAKISLYSQIQTNSVLYIQGDQAQIYRLLMNLVSNGINYTPANGEVTIMLQSDNNQAIITVKDTGIGIPESDISHIFDRFYRVNRDRSRNTGGSGLGLAIASAIAQAHKGRLEVDSILNQGSTFSVILPLVSKVNK